MTLPDLIAALTEGDRYLLRNIRDYGDLNTVRPCDGDIRKLVGLGLARHVCLPSRWWDITRQGEAALRGPRTGDTWMS